MSGPLLSVRNLRVSIRRKDAPVPIVRGVNFDIGAGEILGLAGESGCGKSITALAIMGLLPAREFIVEADRMWLESQDLGRLSQRDWRSVRGSRISMIFQDPAASLDPVFTIGHQVGFAARRAGKKGLRPARTLAIDALGSVGFSNPEAVLSAYPHELSGGMRQLAMVAMAIASEPSLVLADEPTTALDVTTQARLLQLLKLVSKQFGTSVLLISHDLGAVAQCAEKAMIMYAGQIVEQSACRDLFSNAHHPYTAGLLAALPRIELETVTPVRAISGRVPTPGDLPPGCPFEPRCERADGVCRERNPSIGAGQKTGAACHHPL